MNFCHSAFGSEQWSTLDESLM